MVGGISIHCTGNKFFKDGPCQYLLEKMRLERKQEALKKQEKEDRENAKKAEEELKELEVEEKKLRDKVYSDAEEAKSAQCLMEARDGKECQGPGNQVCKNVISQEGRQTDICLKRSD